MSQPTQPHQAPLALTHQPRALSMFQQPALGTHTPSTVAGVYSQPPVQRRRVNEDIFLNIVLYIGSLLLIGAAGLFVTSVTSSKDETAMSASSRWVSEPSSSILPVCSPTVSLSVYVSPPALLQRPVWRLSL